MNDFFGGMNNKKATNSNACVLFRFKMTNPEIGNDFQIKIKEGYEGILYKLKASIEFTLSHPWAQCSLLAH